jgi:hypothetical protein
MQIFNLNPLLSTAHFSASKASRFALASALALVMLIIAGWSPARGQATGPQPGATDPVGAPDTYTTLRSDDLMIGSFVSGNLQMKTRTVDEEGLLSIDIPQASNDSVRGLGSSVSAAGHILSQNNEQIVNVGRSPAGDAVSVLFPLEKPAIAPVDLPDLQLPVTNVPDSIHVAVGDLDKIPDQQGVNHDEVAIAYGSTTGELKLAVLNYSGPSPAAPLYVTQITVPATTYDQPIHGVSVAIGDFDGDGQNEIAVATARAGIVIRFFRYVHKLRTDTPTLSLVSNIEEGGTSAISSISLVAGNFYGSVNNQAQLILAWSYRLGDPPYLEMKTAFFMYDADKNLVPRYAGGFLLFSQPFENVAPSDLTVGRIKAVAGLFRYDPSNGFDLYRREIAVAFNEPHPLSDDTAAKLDIGFFQVLDGQIEPLNEIIQLDDYGVGPKFDFTAGGLTVDSRLNSPLWSLALVQLRSPIPEEDSPKNLVATFTLAPDRSLIEASSEDSAAGDCPGCFRGVAEDNAIQPTLQAYDYRGRTVFLGAPVRITANDLINTDFVLEEPPKHAYWDEAEHKLIVLSRLPAIATSLTNKKGVSFTGRSTDMSANAIGASLALSASASTTAGAWLAQGKITLETTAKAAYNYDLKESSYNLSYSSRTLSETESTDNDDFISFRAQTLEIWRYRVLGVSSKDADGRDVNAFIDYVFPGPSLDLKAGGLDLDWYQPYHENGNILSYPQPNANTFNPPDLGTYEIPCPTGAGDCVNARETQSGAMIPPTAEFIDNTSGSISLDYSNNTGSGNTIMYEHKLAGSLDIKVGYEAKVGFLGIGEESKGSVAVNFSDSNSWGNTATSDSATTEDTGLKITRAAIDPTRAYEFWPTVYATQDGTIKVAHAVAPLASSSGKAFWARLYGKKPDPALNLPLRFKTAPGSIYLTWIPNTEASRKQLRGFSVLSADPDPVTGQYVPLAQAPLDGDRVRLSVEVYNYSTAKSFVNCAVKFFAIKYDSDTDQEVGARQEIGTTSISAAPLQHQPAQIVWDTKGFGPTTGGGQQYRIYVDLNYDGKIDETYPPEDPNKDYDPNKNYPTLNLKGVDPGQNDEGFGSATVMAKSAAPQADNFYVSPEPLVVEEPGGLPTGNGAIVESSVPSRVVVASGVPMRVRARVCDRGHSRDPVDVVLFDGDPAKGKLIGWKRTFVPDAAKCDGVWFDWTPPSAGKHTLEAEVLECTPQTSRHCLETGKIRTDRKRREDKRSKTKDIGPAWNQSLVEGKN